MRLVKPIFAILTAFMLLVAVSPVAAAASAEAIPALPYAGTAPLWATVSLMGLGALVGITIQLTARDGDAEQLIELDTEDKDSFMKRLRRYVSLKTQEKISPLKEQLEAASSENDSLRSIIVGEIMRVRKLTSGEDFDAEEEKEYLEGLPVKRLKMEYERLPDPEEIELKASTTNEDPDDSEDDLLAKFDPDAE